MSDANNELVRHHFEETFNRKNLAVCYEIMAEDFVEHAAAPFTVSALGRVRGPQAMRKRRLVPGTVLRFARDDRSGDLGRTYRDCEHPLGSLKASWSSTGTTRDALTPML